MAKNEDNFRYTVQIGQMTWPEEMTLCEAYKLLDRFRQVITNTEMKLIRVEG